MYHTYMMGLILNEFFLSLTDQTSEYRNISQKRSKVLIEVH